MFGKLKDKLKSWFSKTKEEVEEKPEELKEEPKPEIKVEEVKSEIKEEVKVKEKPVEPVKPVEIKPVEIEEELRTAPTIEQLEVEKEEEIKEKKPSFFKRIKSTFAYKLNDEDFEEFFSELEFLLLENNVALEAVEKIKETLKEKLVGKEIKKQEIEQEIKKALKQAIEELLIEPDDFISLVKEKKPFIIVFFGINGTGKTTTIAKVANLLKKNNISCILSASDTFRAASIEQLEKHGSNLGIKVIKQDYNSDPAAVAYDAIKHAESHNIGAVLIDTAGRMHTQDNLMKEMEKIVRITDPDLKIFVAESIAGNDAVEQAKAFNENIGIDGIILSKADVDEKGGTALSVSYVTKRPILFLGTGQEYDKLEVFNKDKLLKSLGLD